MLISEQSLLSFYTDGTGIVVKPWGLTFSVQGLLSHIFGHAREEYIMQSDLCHNACSAQLTEKSSVYQLIWMPKARF